MLRMLRQNNKAFTIVEILAVTLLMAGLIGIAAVGITANVKKGKIRTAKAQIGTFEQAISLFELECSFYPSELEDLVQNNSGQKCKDFPKEGFLRKQEIPQDPWNNDYNYRKPGYPQHFSYDLWSNGPNGEDGDTDDVTNWKAQDSDADTETE
jgi:general secretion pathway protein G